MPGRPTQALINQLKEMRQDETNQRDWRIGTFLLEMIEQGQNTFTALDWGTRFDLTKTQYGNDVRRAVNLGLVTKKVISTYQHTNYVHLTCFTDDRALRRLIKHLDYSFQIFLLWNPYIYQSIQKNPKNIESQNKCDPM